VDLHGKGGEALARSPSSVHPKPASLAQHGRWVLFSFRRAWSSQSPSFSIIIVNRPYSHGPSHAVYGGNDIFIANVTGIVSEKMVFNAG
jgi:hypothetical protein